MTEFKIFLFYISIIVILQSIQLSFAKEKESEGSSSEESEEFASPESWNELKFTQNWGYTACKQFKSEKGEGVKCQKEDQPSIWSIHGIWPTKLGTSGPNFCSKVTFDINALSVIRPKLNEFWYEIAENLGPDKFWKHEWQKHGSCAAEVEAFNTEVKYFEKGLTFRSLYDLFSILKGAGIVPQTSDGYHVKEISDSIEKALGGTPIIQCFHTKESGQPEQYLLAVEICLDRDLKIRNCKSKKLLKNGSAGPCINDQKIKYTDNFEKFTDQKKEL